MQDPLLAARRKPSGDGLSTAGGLTGGLAPSLLKVWKQRETPGFLKSAATWIQRRKTLKSRILGVFHDNAPSKGWACALPLTLACMPSGTVQLPSHSVTRSQSRRDLTTLRLVPRRSVASRSARGRGRGPTIPPHGPPMVLDWHRGFPSVVSCGARGDTTPSSARQPQNPNVSSSIHDGCPLSVSSPFAFFCGSKRRHSPLHSPAELVSVDSGLCTTGLQFAWVRGAFRCATIPT